MICDAQVTQKIVESICICALTIVIRAHGTCRQHNAPTDIMGLFSAIYDRVNEDLEDVVQVEINYVGDVIHRFDPRVISRAFGACSRTTAVT